MPDWNPDREAHRDHKWIVHNATRRKDFRGVRVADREMLFDREGRFSVDDEGVAAEIRKEHPHDVTVSRVNAQHVSDRGHKYFFAGIAMPWHKEKEDGKEEEKVDQGRD